MVHTSKAVTLNRSFLWKVIVIWSWNGQISVFISSVSSLFFLSVSISSLFLYYMFTCSGCSVLPSSWFDCIWLLTRTGLTASGYWNAQMWFSSPKIYTFNLKRLKYFSLKIIFHASCDRWLYAWGSFHCK
jgi:hypothetical protein